MFRVSIIGNLGGEPKVRTASNGREFMSMSVAISKRDKSTMWVNVTANKQEGLIQYLTKGRQIFVCGECNIGTYQGQPDVDVYADRIELCGKAADGGETASDEGDNTF